MKRAITALSVLIIAFALFSNFETRVEAKKKEKEVIKIEDVYTLGTPIKIEDLPEGMIKAFGKSCTNFLCRTKKATGIMSKSFSRGKNQKNRWGKIKIAYELKNKGLNNKEITLGLESIEEKTYYKILMKSIEVYKRKSKKFEKNKLIKHLINKGYETSLVISTIKKLNC